MLWGLRAPTSLVSLGNISAVERSSRGRLCACTVWLLGSRSQRRTSPPEPGHSWHCTLVFAWGVFSLHRGGLLLTQAVLLAELPWALSCGERRRCARLPRPCQRPPGSVCFPEARTGSGWLLTFLLPGVGSPAAPDILRLSIRLTLLPGSPSSECPDPAVSSPSAAPRAAPPLSTAVTVVRGLHPSLAPRPSPTSVQSPPLVTTVAPALCNSCCLRVCPLWCF